MNKNILSIIVGVVFLVVGIMVGQSMGKSSNYEKGYDQALADIKSQQEELGQKAATEAAKAANPFQAANPLEGVSANPFDDAAKKLNPFAE
jgi:hypothetical protein